LFCAAALSEVLSNLGLKHITLAPLHRIEDGINAVRMLIPRCWFDQAKCARGLDALKLYRADYEPLRNRDVRQRRAVAHADAGKAVAKRQRVPRSKRRNREDARRRQRRCPSATTQVMSHCDELPAGYAEIPVARGRKNLIGREGLNDP
jgi:hypothetical protein